MTRSSWCDSLRLGPGDETKADLPDCLDIARSPGVVLEFPAQAAEVAREAVVSDLYACRAHDSCEFAVGDHNTGPGGTGVEEDVLVRRKPDLARPSAYAWVERIDLQIGNPKKSHAATLRNSIARQRDQHGMVQLRAA
jgi:hypothetical protein